MRSNKDKPYELSHEDDEDIPVFEGAVTFQGNYEPMDEYYEKNCDDVEVKRETDEESTAKNTNENTSDDNPAPIDAEERYDTASDRSGFLTANN